MPGQNLPSSLSWSDAFSFPIVDPAGRRDILIGGLLLMGLWPIGWVLNLGNRLNVVSRLYHGDQPYFRGFKPWGHTLKRGCVSAATIFAYLTPSGTFLLAANLVRSPRPGALAIGLTSVGMLLFLAAIFTLPGCMTVYATQGDAAVLYSPLMAFRRAWQHRRVYLKAWLIGFGSVLISFLGLLLLGLGFFFSSVWAWEVVGYAFTVAMYITSGRTKP